MSARREARPAWTYACLFSISGRADSARLSLHHQRDGPVIPSTLLLWLSTSRARPPPVFALLRPWSSLLVAIPFPVSACREIRSRNPKIRLRPAPSAAVTARDRASSLYFPCGSGIGARETGSHQTGPTAIQSAVAETVQPLSATLPRTPALSRGLGRGPLYVLFIHPSCPSSCARPSRRPIKLLRTSDTDGEGRRRAAIRQPWRSPKVVNPRVVGSAHP